MMKTMKVILRNAKKNLKKINFFKIFALIAIQFACFSISWAQVPDWSWAKRFGGSSYEGGYCTATDGAGNVYIAGEFKSTTVLFGPYTLTNSGGYDIFIAKFDPNGNVLWAKGIGGAADEKGDGICTDASGNVYLTGFFRSPSLSFGGYTITNSDSADVFVAKYDPSGNALWAKSASGNLNDYGHGISCDANNHVYVAGYFKSQTLTFGPYTLTNDSAGFNDIFLVKFDANGNVLWAHNYGGKYTDDATSIAIDLNGNIYLTGFFYSAKVIFGNYSVNKSGSYEIFLAKFNSSGTALWAVSAGDTADDRAYHVAVDSLGNAYITGFFNSPSMTIGSDVLIHVDSADIFVAKYDQNGNALWGRCAGGSSPDEATSIAISANGNVFLSGYFKSSSLTFGIYTLTNALNGKADIFLTKYDTDGNVQWAKGVGGTSSDYAESISLDASGNLYMTGRFYSATLSFGSNSLTKAGWDDIFIAKIYGGTDGINEFTDNNFFSIYFNPAASQITILCNDNIMINDFTAYIYNMNGQLVKQQKIVQTETVIEVGSLPLGVYTTKVSNINKTACHYFVVY